MKRIVPIKHRQLSIEFEDWLVRHYAQIKHGLGILLHVRLEPVRGGQAAITGASGK
jgi:hypothetical protein